MPADSSFVITGPLGGATHDLDEICDNVAARTGTALEASADNVDEDYWPRVPDNLKPPAAHLEAAVREVNYIAQVLTHCHAPTKVEPSFDVRCYSDLLLSLETRRDLTRLVLQFSSANLALFPIKSLKDLGHDGHSLASRAEALEQHWKQASEAGDERADVVVGPFIHNLPSDKPEGWKLQLSDEASEVAGKLYLKLRNELERNSSYFNLHPPKPMAWFPVNDQAWSETDRDKIRTGDLFHSKNWRPMERNASLVSAPIRWNHPDWSEKQTAERYELLGWFLAWIGEMKNIELKAENIFKD